jgi:hypothetical protein
LEFNDHVPEEFHGDEQDFYREFQRLFKTNAYWSTAKPVPEIGDENST